MRPSRACSLFLVGLLPLLTGCTFTTIARSTPDAGLAITGQVHGGQQPVSGAHIYLLASNTAGYNTTGAIYPSLSLLKSTGANVTLDSSGGPTNGFYYVTSDANGSFTITGDYTCTPDSGGIPGQQVYLYAMGGNAGAGINASAGMLAVLGDCPTATTFAIAYPLVAINEVSTIAAAYAMAGFAYDATHVSSSATNLAKVGVKNAFLNASNLASITSGYALNVTPAGNGVVPQTTINTLADILASCVNSNGTVTNIPTATPCYTLFYNAKSNATVPVVPSETATAAINIAHSPGANIANLYGSPTPTSPFAPTLAAQPNDFTVALNFSGGGLSTPRGAIAIDASGNAWIANYGNSSLTELSSTGSPTSPSTGYTGGGMSSPQAIAIDTSGSVWVANFGAPSISKFSSTGMAVSGSGGYTGGGLSNLQSITIDGAGYVWTVGSSNVISKFSGGTPVSSSSGYTGGGLNNSRSIAIDGAGNAWTANPGNGSISKFSNAGAPFSGSSGYTGGGVSTPQSVAMDSAGNVWIANFGSNLSEFSNAGTAVSGSNGYTGGGLNNPRLIAIDGAGNAWSTNYSNSSISEFSNTGTALSGSTGYSGGGLSSPWGIAIDNSGDTWITNTGNSTVTEIIGAAIPVITPIAAGLPTTPTADGSSNLGTRP